ncbi:MAG: hypothetical protein IPK18_14125 [Sphingobacteriales bacterium]|nr:MAG: hypothetical protein IPK18_14125 [Sphingobacteriales bacterium]
MNYNLLLKVSIINFIILSILGVLLRFIVIYPISFITYKNLKQAHSHLVFNAVITLFGTILLIKKFEIEYLYQTKFKYSIVVLIFTAYGMLFAFSYQGYKLVSIIFHKQHTIILLAYKLLLFFLVVSSIAPFCLGYLMKSNLAYSPIYYNTVYFYLHFQYNGFFIFIIILLVLLNLKKDKDTNKIKLFLYTYASSVILTYTISLLWHNANPIKYTISFIGSALQCISIYFLFQTSKFSFANTYKNKNYLLLFITLCYIAKLVMQLIISIPLFSHSFITNRNIIIAFLHLTLIGVVWLSFYYNATKHIKQWNYHIFVFCIIFITTEVLLFISSILPIQNIANYLFYTSIFFPISLVGIYKHSTKNALDKI